jgi:hypothetical protein
VRRLTLLRRPKNIPLPLKVKSSGHGEHREPCRKPSVRLRIGFSHDGDHRQRLGLS